MSLFTFNSLSAKQITECSTFQWRYLNYLLFLLRHKYINTSDDTETLHKVKFANAFPEEIKQLNSWHSLSMYN